MKANKTKPTNIKVDDFLLTVDAKRREEAQLLIKLMHKITNLEPAMWGPSIIGFGSEHYKYETGREGDMPQLAFSPRKASITVYFTGGFEQYSPLLSRLGKYKTSVSCLYINKLSDINIEILEQMLEQSHRSTADSPGKPKGVEDYIARVPTATRPLFDELRNLVVGELPQAKEVLSYGIIGYKIDDKRARVFISGWKDHVSMYPIPNDPNLQKRLKIYTKGKGTLWFSLDKPLPKTLLQEVIQALARP